MYRNQNADLANSGPIQGNENLSKLLLASPLSSLGCFAPVPPKKIGWQEKPCKLICWQLHAKMLRVPGPRWLRGKEFCWRRCRRQEFDPRWGRSPAGGNNNTQIFSAWRILWTQKPIGLWSKGLKSQRLNDWAWTCTLRICFFHSIIGQFYLYCVVLGLWICLKTWALLALASIIVAQWYANSCRPMDCSHGAPLSGLCSG